jgi:hypothetical protein
MRACIPKTLIGLTLAATLLAGCKCCQRGTERTGEGTAPVILQQPIPQIVATGAVLLLEVVAQNPPPFQTNSLSYQWYFNGAPIAGATADLLTITNFQLSNIGTYTVAVTGPGGSSESDSTGVGIGDPTGNSGTLPPIPLSSFTSNPSGSQSCFPNPPWDKRYTVPGYFFKSYPSPPNPNFPNTGSLPNLTVDTCDSANGTTCQTGIVIYNAISPSDKVCATNSQCIVSSTLTINTRSMADSKLYRVTIYYKSSAPPPGPLIVHWQYH